MNTKPDSDQPVTTGNNPTSQLDGNATIAVIGAGAFGGWTSLWLRRKGFKVINIDQWGPGNAWSSSGGETRLHRFVYGAESIYTKLAVRAHQLWLENEKKFGKQLFFPNGVLWFTKDVNNSDFIKTSLRHFQEVGLSFDKLSPDEARKRYPFLHVDDLSALILEKTAGYLMAREACQSVTKAFVSEGGTYLQSPVKPGSIKNNQLDNLLLKDSKLKADVYVFACGPWIGDIFPEVMKGKITITRQEVFYFGLPPHLSTDFENCQPPWLDLDGEDVFYGFPKNQHRGFKIAAHRRGKVFDPSNDDRVVSTEALERARDYLAFRFPSLKKMPLIESRVCQYTNTPDDHFIFDLHPGADNVWILGGGSGHGFKHGPALGELAAAVIAGEKPVLEACLFKRFQA
ncbi:FAD-dependent oxidoreductase [Fulvivirgaceae bacterium BMA12]|uniref:FAD-dependent oxidoreductase n=1 Tax=Agaribacillus aureus TaxID=3051825 RepID=A0ABT8L8G6_9BACT|nr:FAD-dependent oxidoreductase [Fulvivirgaceae bacterium BMA12]